ncbi:hypothetical protein CLOSTHATH_02299 [Hungatella hathewayi DSM 13479]|uniref:Uncharacterized protein n=1 Tax=Hungatella hathewayi DSM 13479 TaxID=566550 RepID=D3AFB4_9FIRM|nr:hypothetical protein CLOSTHATH_02299 [Hungatella hathewayi DSM 13479]
MILHFTWILNFLFFDYTELTGKIYKNKKLNADFTNDNKALKIEGQYAERIKLCYSRDL